MAKRRNKSPFKGHKKNKSKNQNRNQSDKPKRRDRGRGGDRDRSRNDERREPRQEFRGPRRQQKTYVGRVQKNPRGFAFILSQDPELEDTYVSKEEARVLMNDDLVEYTVRRDGRRLSAEITNIVERGQKEVVGQVDRGYIVTPDGESHRLESTGKAIDGEWIIAEIVDYPTFRSAAKVSIKKILGLNLLPEHDIMVAAAQFGLPTNFSPQAMQEARSAQPPNFPADFEGTGRKDLRAMPFITIDGEDAKDFDDAILVDNKGKSPFVLYVAIADVSYYVREGTPLDKDAYSRSTSVYFPGVCIPMLPESLSNDLCSLRPQQERLTMTAEIHLDRDGNILHSYFYESIIKTVRRCTYTEIQAYWDRDPKMREELKPIAAPLEAAFALYRKMQAQRGQRGVLDFDLPESKIIVDKEGKPLEVKKADRGESNKLIEEFMIAANREVARALRERGILTLYRVHEAPDPTAVDEINGLMRSLGISQKLKDMSTHSLSKVLADTAGLKGAKTLHQQILRSLKQAKYEPDPKGHFGLALQDYAHFTSPIRRYPDLVVHRSLKKLSGQKGKADSKSGSPEHFEAQGVDTSERERRAMEAERFVVKRKQCWFMKDRVGETFNGVIAGVVEKGVFVEIPEFALEGFVQIESLKGYYQYDESKKCLRMRPGHTTLSLGDPLKIQVESVSIEENKINFVEAEK